MSPQEKTVPAKITLLAKVKKKSKPVVLKTWKRKIKKGNNRFVFKKSSLSRQAKRKLGKTIVIKVSSKKAKPKAVVVKKKR